MFNLFQNFRLRWIGFFMRIEISPFAPLLGSAARLALVHELLDLGLDQAPVVVHLVVDKLVGGGGELGPGQEVERGFVLAGDAIAPQLALGGVHLLEVLELAAIASPLGRSKLCSLVLEVLEEVNLVLVQSVNTQSCQEGNETKYL